MGELLDGELQDVEEAVGGQQSERDAVGEGGPGGVENGLLDAEAGGQLRGRRWRELRGPFGGGGEAGGVDVAGGRGQTRRRQESHGRPGWDWVDPDALKPT